MEHRIGQIVTLSDGRKAEVVEECHGICGGCMFAKLEEEYDCVEIVGLHCSSIHRTDHKNVIYKEIKEE